MAIICPYYELSQKSRMTVKVLVERLEKQNYFGRQMLTLPRAKHKADAPTTQLKRQLKLKKSSVAIICPYDELSQNLRMTVNPLTLDFVLALGAAAVLS